MVKILVVDDDEQIRNLLEEILTAEGYEVATADNGLTGMEWLNRELCDLAIIDIIMPEKEGAELIHELHRQQPVLKIIAISGGGVHVDADHALNVAKILGASHTLNKPFTKSDILPLVHDLIGPPKVG